MVGRKRGVRCGPRVDYSLTLEPSARRGWTSVCTGGCTRGWTIPSIHPKVTPHAGLLHCSQVQCTPPWKTLVDKECVTGGRIA